MPSPTKCLVLRKTPWTDAVLLLGYAAAWVALALGGVLATWPRPLLAAVAVIAALALCKGLSWPPRRRAPAALVPVLATTAAALVAGGAAARGAQVAILAVALAAGAYVVFDWSRRRWSELVHLGPDGRPDGFDYGHWYRWSERVHWRRRTWRVLFPLTDKEATLRAGGWQPGDRIAFADFTAPDLVDTLAAHDLVVPLSAPDLRALEPWRAQLAGQAIALPSRACIELCEDKPRFNRALVEHGFGAHVPPMDGPFAFPYIVKKRHAEWGEHSHVVATPDDEQRYAAELADPAYFRQAFVPGRTEFTTHVLVRGGRIVRSLTLAFTFAHDLPVKSRHCAAIAIRLRRCAHLRLFAAILRAIGFDGLCCFNYKLVDGRPLIFEVNPRFGASLAPYFPTFLRSLS